MLVTILEIWKRLPIMVIVKFSLYLTKINHYLLKQKNFPSVDDQSIEGKFFDFRINELNIFNCRPKYAFHVLDI